MEKNKAYAALLVLAGSFFIEGAAGKAVTLLAGAYLFYQLGVKKILGGIPEKISDKLRDPVEDEDRISQFAAITYFILLAAMFIYYRATIAPDHILFIGLFGAAILKKTRTFIDDWIPFIVLLLSYESLRGVAEDLTGRVSYTLPIVFEKIIFLGGLPTTLLQEKLYAPGQCSWQDQAAIIFYMTHFITVLSFGYLLWIRDRKKFKEFRAAILTVSYMALLTYLILPVAPPWMAYNDGYLAEEVQVVGESCEKIYTPFESLYFLLNANPVAALPSLHLTYPYMILLYSIRYFGRKGWLAAILPVGVAFSTVYLGQHYVVDLLAGMLYAHIAVRITDRGSLNLFKY